MRLGERRARLCTLCAATVYRYLLGPSEVPHLRPAWVRKSEVPDEPAIHPLNGPHDFGNGFGEQYGETGQNQCDVAQPARHPNAIELRI